MKKLAAFSTILLTLSALTLTGCKDKGAAPPAQDQKINETATPSVTTTKPVDDTTTAPVELESAPPAGAKDLDAAPSAKGKEEKPTEGKTTTAKGKGNGNVKNNNANKNVKNENTGKKNDNNAKETKNNEKFKNDVKNIVKNEVKDNKKPEKQEKQGDNNKPAATGKVSQTE